MKKKIIFGVIILIILTWTSLVGAANYSAKALGMGGAFTGLANDTASLLYNPAGLAQSGFLGLQLNAGMASNDLGSLGELNDKFFLDDLEEDASSLFDLISHDLQLNGGVFAGINIGKLAAGAVKSIDTSYYRQGEEQINLNSSSSFEGMLTLSYQLTDPGFDLGTLALGANLKMIQNEVLDYNIINNEGNITIEEYSKSGQGMGLDLGGILKVTPLLTLGAQIRNLWTSDAPLEVAKRTYDGSEWSSFVILPDEDNDLNKRVMRVGAAVKVPVLNATLVGDIDKFPLGTDKDAGDPVLHLGIEKNLLFNGLSLRAGTYEPEDGDRVYTAGLGLNIYKLHFDAALATDSQQENISGVFSLNMLF